jgi:hypothetical protein
MKPRFELGLDSLPLDAIDADVAVAGIFVEDRPLRGGAGRVDWRLCGQISEMLFAGSIDAARGCAALMAATDVFRAPRIMLLGLGSRRDFGLMAAQDLMREAVERCLALGVRRIALAPLGVASDDFVRHAAAVAGGAAEAIRGGDGVVPIQEDFEVRLSVPEAGIEVASEALAQAVSAFEDPAIVTRSVTRRHHKPSPVREMRGGGIAHFRP